MTWDETKQTLNDRPDIDSAEKLTSADWNDMVADQKDHATRHEDGGVDELNVQGLSGLLADPQTPDTEDVQDIVGAFVEAATGSNISVEYDDANDTLIIDTTALNPEETRDTVNDLLVGGSNTTLTYDDDNDTLTIDVDAPTTAEFEDHSTRHESGGADELSVTGLSGDLADEQDAKPHDIGGATHNADTLANLNSKVSDATLDDTNDTREPEAHSTTHESGGADEISVDGLSGDLADAQDPKGHTTTHQSGGSDEIPLNGLELPAGAYIDEDGGDLVVRDSGGSIVLRRDEAAGAWDFVSGDLTGIASLEAGSVSTVALETGELLGGRKVAVDGDIQAKLDEADRRAAFVYVPGDLGTATQAETILLGQDSVLEGETANLDEQPSGGFGEYSPRPVLEWDTDITGIQWDPDANYRTQGNEITDLTLVGSGEANGQIGIDLAENGNDRSPGLAELDDVYVRYFETCVGGSGDEPVASLINNCHFSDCKNGVGPFKFSVIRDSTFWQFREPGGAAIELGARCCALNNLIEPSASGGVESVDGVHISGRGCLVHGNQFKDVYGTGVFVDNVRGATVSDNDFTTDLERGIDAGEAVRGLYYANSFIEDIGDAGIIANNASFVGFNDFGSSGIGSGSTAIKINGNFCVVAHNRFASSHNSIIELNGDDNIVVGDLPIDVDDNGDRNIINGISKNHGSPNSTGVWNGEHELGRRRGVTIHDTDEGQIYMPAPDESSFDWLRIDN